jgi:hypothetical protein
MAHVCHKLTDVCFSVLKVTSAKALAPSLNPITLILQPVAKSWALHMQEESDVCLNRSH